MPTYKIEVTYGNDTRTFLFEDTRSLETLAQDVSIKGGIKLVAKSASNEGKPIFFFAPSIVSISLQ